MGAINIFQKIVICKRMMTKSALTVIRASKHAFLIAHQRHVFFCFFICFLENVWSFACCICSRFPCCYHLCRCSCKRAYCSCIKCLHRCLGCKCSCSFTHHDKEYGRYKDDRRDTLRNSQDVQDLSGFAIENTDEKLEMIADKEKLLEEFTITFKNIAKCADCIKNSALFDELPPEIEELRKYRENLKNILLFIELST